MEREFITQHMRYKHNFNQPIHQDSSSDFKLQTTRLIFHFRTIYYSKAPFEMSAGLPFQYHRVPACSCIFCTTLSVVVNHLPASLTYTPLHSHISETVFISETLESSSPLSAVINRKKTNYSPYLW